jgi:superfamily II DNA or RNA helicase
MASVGWGKTLLSANIFKSSYQRGKKSMFTVPRNALIEPSVEEFEGQGLTDIGIIQQDHPRTNPDAKLQVASIHTAVNRPMDPPHLVILDEVHLEKEEFNKLLDSEEWSRTVVIALSATPYKKGMGRRWKKLIQTKSTAQLIEEGYLVKPRYLVGSVDPDLAGKKTHVNEEGNRVLSERDEANVMGDKEIIGDVVKTWLKYGENRPGFYYAVSLAHARQLRDEFELHGISCGYIDGSMDRKQRSKMLRMYREGKYTILVNYGVLTTGIDEDVRVIGICRIIKSEIDWVQIIGRALRTDNPSKRVAGQEPKVDALIIDHGGNLTREDGTAMPPAEDIYHDYLDDHDPNDKEQKAFDGDKKPDTHRKCKNCGYLIPPRTKLCPACGNENLAPSGVTAVSAEFSEFIKKEKAEKKAKKERAKKEKTELDERRKYYGWMLWIGETRGFKQGWANHRFHEKFNKWPDGLKAIAHKPPKEVMAEEHRRAVEFRKANEKKPEPEPEYMGEY